MGCNIFVLITLRELQRAEMKCARWRSMELGGGW